MGIISIVKSNDSDNLLSLFSQALDRGYQTLFYSNCSWEGRQLWYYMEICRPPPPFHSYPTSRSRKKHGEKQYRKIRIRRFHTMLQRRVLLRPKGRRTSRRRSPLSANQKSSISAGCSHCLKRQNNIANMKITPSIRQYANIHISSSTSSIWQQQSCIRPWLRYKIFQEFWVLTLIPVHNTIDQYSTAIGWRFVFSCKLFLAIGQLHDSCRVSEVFLWNLSQKMKWR